MNQKDDIEVRRAALLKKARGMVRMNYSVMADEELNRLLPQLEREFNAYVSDGILPSLGELLARIEDGNGGE